MNRFLAFLIPIWATPCLAWTPYDVHGMSYFYGMAVADFDKDGRQEVAYADSLAATRKMGRSSDALVYQSNLETSQELIFREDFSWHPANSSPNPHHLIERMVAIDINSDTWLDIVAVANSHDAVVAYINPGASGDWSRQVLTTSTPGAVNIVTGDPDGDGDADILVTMRSQTASWPARKSGLGWLRNDGGGLYTYKDIDVQSTSGYDEPRTLIAFDVWGDGKDEVTVANMTTGQLSTYRLMSGAWHKYVASGVAVQSYYSAAMDVDGDGLKEVIYATRDGIYYARTNWSVTNPQLGKLADISLRSSEYVSEIKIADVTGDGVSDVVFGVAKAGLYYLDGGSGWAFRQVTSDGANYLNIDVMDFDNDGKIDVIGGIEYPSNTMRVWRND